MFKLVPNAKQVASTAASMWAVYGAFAIDAAIKIVQYFEANREVKWQDAITPVALILIGMARLMQQKALETATQEALRAEKMTVKALEHEVMQPSPPMTERELAALKQDVKAIIKEQP